ncbi:MAG: hypothetical protein MUF64_02805 [Polyangiaceae bacterium]|jgi:hypothetical protein|nr:hypothetical protein [Polyangiaceae bacterium]
MVGSVPKARNLSEAYRVLDPRPLDFSSRRGLDSVASDPSFYTPAPTPQGAVRPPSPIDGLIRAIRLASRYEKHFLCGHVGSGKSTELSKLAVNPDIKKRFEVVSLRIEEHEWATLDSMQLRFLIAEAIFRRYKQEITADERLMRSFSALSNAIFQPMGLVTADGSASLEFDLLIVKLKQELKLSDKARRQFRELGETNRSLLQDLQTALTGAVEAQLSMHQDRPDRMLILVDDLDKVRNPEHQKEIFDTNLGAILAMSVDMVLTLPTGVLFGENRAEIRSSVTHLYPPRVLRKSPDCFDPDRAAFPDRLAYFQDLVDHRIEPGLIDPEAIRLAAIHSGGVLRDFFRLLRAGVDLADFNGLDRLDLVAMRIALDEARRNESIGLYTPDYETLLQVHLTNELPRPEDRRLLDLARVIECYNGSVWFEANPILWPLLEERSKKNVRPAPAQGG